MTRTEEEVRMRSVFVYEYLSGGGDLDGEAADCLLPQGVAMRNAIVADLLRVPEVAATCAVCDRPGAHAPPGVGLTATPRNGESAAAFVQCMAAEHDLTWVVAPETQGLLAHLNEAVGPAGWIGCSAGAIRTASSKSATLEALARGGVLTPLAFADRPGLRWVVKPDDGAGSVDTIVHRDRALAQADMETRHATRRSATLEPFVEGEAMSMSLLAQALCVEAIAFNRQDITVAPNGAVVFNGVRHCVCDPVNDPRVAALHGVAADVARVLPGLQGFVGVDLVWHPSHGPVVIEVNPRVTTAYVGLSAVLGRNLAAEIVAMHGAAEARHGRS
jgi:predicted ATP-grasp superfamily ATP-dependent carboligase